MHGLPIGALLWPPFVSPMRPFLQSCPPISMQFIVDDKIVFSLRLKLIIWMEIL